jgi:HAD superfamily phosphoserine phosphatase-like hydrolase
MIIASDVEGTLSNGTTWKAIGKYLVEHGRERGYKIQFYGYVPLYLLSKVHLIDPVWAGNRWFMGLAKVMKGMTQQEVDDLGEWVVANELWPNRRTAVTDELTAYTQQGHRVILTSGAFEGIVNALAKRIGAQSILGTQLEMTGGKATGRIVGKMNTGKVKARRLLEALGGSPLDMAYGDTLADKFMLEKAVTPIAVNPDKGLKAEAEGRGWRIVVA